MLLNLSANNRKRAEICFILMASISSAFTGKEVEQVSAAPKNRATR
jgi:hypothetical protein